jgi:hypothetical protein
MGRPKCLGSCSLVEFDITATSVTTRLDPPRWYQRFRYIYRGGRVPQYNESLVLRITVKAKAVFSGGCTFIAGAAE